MLVKTLLITLCYWEKYIMGTLLRAQSAAKPD